MFLRLFGLSILLIFMLTLCTEKSNIDKKDNIKISDNDKQVIDNKRFNSNDIIKSFSPDSLVNFLPNIVPGTKKSPYQKGSREEMDIIISVASCQYIFNNDGFLKYRITDYGAKSFIPIQELKLFDNPPNQSGRTTEEIIIPNGKGFTIWDPGIHEGTFYGFLADRYILRIDGYNLPKSLNGLQEYIKYFKMKELIEFTNKK